MRRRFDQYVNLRPAYLYEGVESPLRDKALPALKKELLSAEAGENAERVRRLVADLDDADPKVRNRALEGLRPVGASAEPALRKALETDLGMEVDISVIREGGPFDQGPYLPLLEG